ncbi:MAG: ABC-type transport auxiliary lipoprotein family protein [Desulfobacterales bacterium]
MNCTRKILYVFISLILFAPGCLSLKKPVIKIDYYTLEYDSPDVAFQEQLPFVVRIERFLVTPVYNSSRIVYSEQKFKRAAYNYHRWHSSPGDLVTYFLARDMRKSNLFKAVLTYDTRFLSSHAIEGIVDEFYEKDEKDLWKAVLSVSITLVREGEPDISKRVLFQKKYSAKETCEQKTPLALAKAMSNAMAKISEMIITDTYNCLNFSRP